MNTTRARVAVVTGGGSGIGLAIAEALGDAGYVLVLAARGLARLEEAAEKLRERGARVVCVRCDVTDASDVALLARRAHALAHGLASAGDGAHDEPLFGAPRSALERPRDSTGGGAIDVLVNDAGAVDVHDVLDAKVNGHDVYRDMLAVNHLGAVRVCEAFLPSMVEHGAGLVVNVASAASVRAFPRIAAYTTAKHALLGWSRAAAMELAERRAAQSLAGGPALVVLCPYYVRGEMLERAAAGLAAAEGLTLDAARALFAARNPGGALVEPRAIGALVVQLADEAAREPGAVNGRVLVLDGGAPREVDPARDHTDFQAT
jgi:NAD(P)-dependent dehydrogenase (short-subunit alcohol dehydrogenase family)